MLRIITAVSALLISTALYAAGAGYTLTDAHKQQRTVDAYDTVFIEEMTWVEVRDAIAEGKTTAIIATGGVEQNGPFLSTGKHNVILRETTNRIARQLGNALVAPIVPFVPEGNHNPVSGHMRYAGTISLSLDTYKKLLEEIALSLKIHGFKNIVFIGDSGGNQTGMEELAAELNKKWNRDGDRVHYIAEYYDNPRWKQWLEARNVVEKKDGIHHDFRHTALMMLVDPMSVRMPQRVMKGEFSVNGVNLLPLDRTLKLADELTDYQVGITMEAIRKSIGKK
ncbi:creatininase family protein [Porticoccus sp. W117]|uniref:creatininase family protein n=1 Tax=Porticoccus sp. W117 TaxID=3054777 RepID=UPI0025917B50|nr:creatininase family protein [Porticoccus sp. W117]MDM3870833.1 creatininase family protein [Porticoccus sp. W117]